jgi:hypothetical protein
MRAIIRQTASYAAGRTRRGAPAGRHGSALDDPAIFHHHNFIGLLDGGQTVGNHQRGAVFLQLIQRRLNRAFRLGIQRRCRFIQDQDRAVTQQRTRDGNTLTLTAGEQYAVLTDNVSRPLSILLIKSMA